MIKGLYVHIPFCKSICHYCDFCHRLYDEEICSRYLDELEKDLGEAGQKHFETVYLGGGTPTSLSEQQLEKLLSIIDRYSWDREYTIEINPETFSPGKAHLLKEHGINRASIGVQSFDEGLLAEMGRRHRNADVINTIDLLRNNGINNISIDLMYGFSNQKVQDVMSDLKKAAELEVSHISIYELEVHDRTVFGARGYQKADDDTCYLMYRSIIDTLADYGYRQYELSNFARNDACSAHNRIYWKYEDFYGAGAGASGKIGNIRYENTDSITRYLSGQHRKEQISLTIDDIRFEAVMMGLRLLEGIDISEYERRFGCNLLDYYEKPISRNMEKGMLKVDNGHLMVTERGMFLLNDILVDFLD